MRWSSGKIHFFCGHSSGITNKRKASEWQHIAAAVNHVSAKGLSYESTSTPSMLLMKPEMKTYDIMSEMCDHPSQLKVHVYIWKPHGFDEEQLNIEESANIDFMKRINKFDIMVEEKAEGNNLYLQFVLKQNTLCRSVLKLNSGYWSFRHLIFIGLK